MRQSTKGRGLIRLKDMHVKQDQLCDLAAKRISEGGEKEKIVCLRLCECAECESPCLIGMRQLEKALAEDRESVHCGGNCAECRQPCNLYHMEYARAHG